LNRDCEDVDIETFNSEIIGTVLLDACANLKNLVIGGLLNDKGAKVLAETMEKNQKIINLRLLNCVIYEDGLYSILEQGNNLETIDITGCLLCCSGEAFTRYNYGLIKDGILSKLREIRMSVIYNDRLQTKNLLNQMFGPKVRVYLDGVKLKYK
jgi:hypothetical protein